MKLRGMIQPVAIMSAQRSALEHIIEFIRSWSTDDAYQRFGILGGTQWLLAELRSNEKRKAIVARSGRRIIGLLDHVESDGSVHIGVVVDAQFRGRYVASELVSELLREKIPEYPVAAECSTHNRAAIGLLQRCGFERVSVDRDEILWLHR